MLRSCIKDQLACSQNEACFITEKGLFCAPYTRPSNYPLSPTDLNNAPITPGNGTSSVAPTSTQTSTVNSTTPSAPTSSSIATPSPGLPSAVDTVNAWYLSNTYPALRYTGVLVNQTGAACTTMPIPADPELMRIVIIYSQLIDIGTYLRRNDVDLFRAAVSNIQSRGNCALDYYCRPTNEVQLFQPYNIENIFSQRTFPGSLNGTCQPLLPAHSVCFSSASCQNWAAPESLNVTIARGANRTRCSLSDNAINRNNFTEGGTCLPLAGTETQLYNWYRSESQPSGYSAMQRYLLLTSGIFLILAIAGYIRIKHQARERQRQEATRLQSTYRPPDPNDDGLPSYGQHTRDARVTGPASEEIGMYGFPSDPPAGQYNHNNVAMYYPPPTLGPSPMPYPPASYSSAAPLTPAYMAPASSTPPPPTATASSTDAMDPLTAAALSSAAAAVTQDNIHNRDSTIDPFKDQSTMSTSSPHLSAEKEHPLALDESDAHGRPGSGRSLSTTRGSTLLGSSKDEVEGMASSGSSSKSAAIVSSALPEYAAANISNSSASSSTSSVAAPSTATREAGVRPPSPRHPL